MAATANIPKEQKSNSTWIHVAMTGQYQFENNLEVLAEMGQKGWS